MNVSQRARRLADIADELEAARLLVEAGGMATEVLSEEYRAPLDELLREIQTRLEKSVADLKGEMVGELLVVPAA